MKNFRLFGFAVGTLSIVLLSATSVHGQAGGLDLASLHGFTTIDFPGATNTEAYGINPQGDIVGSYLSNGVHAFLLSRGIFTTLDFPGASFTQALGINAQGDIVGRYTPWNGPGQGFLLSKGAWTTIHFRGASNTQAWGINAQGDIVGFYFDDTGIHGFLLSGGAFRTLDFPNAAATEPLGINPRGEIVGIYYNAGADIARPFVLRNGAYTPIDVPGANPASGNVGLAYGINAQGDIVGVFARSDGGRALLLTHGIFSDIGVPTGFSYSPHGINPEGAIVGSYSSGNISHDFVWRN
jgi:uncharacterized membrane protein